MKVMDLARFEPIKRLAVIAMFSDDDLLEKLVLKGGSAIDLFHPSPGRSSIDLDFSIDGDFEEDITSLHNRFEKLLADTFVTQGLIVFDVQFKAHPPTAQTAFPFWGGYVLKFKLVEREWLTAHEKKLNVHRSHRPEKELQDLRSKNALDVGPDQLKTFTIEFSKHEHCLAKEERELDGFTVYVNTPLAIATEKLRAICQQIPSYRERLSSRPGTARPRDFFDIHYLTELYNLDWRGTEMSGLVQAMFEAKKVPLSLLGQIQEYRHFHEQGFPALKDTVRPSHKLESFKFYFEYVLELVEKLEPLWNI